MRRRGRCAVPQEPTAPPEPCPCLRRPTFCSGAESRQRRRQQPAVFGFPFARPVPRQLRKCVPRERCTLQNPRNVVSSLLLGSLSLAYPKGTCLRRPLVPRGRRLAHPKGTCLRRPLVPRGRRLAHPKGTCLRKPLVPRGRRLAHPKGTCLRKPLVPRGRRLALRSSLKGRGNHLSPRFLLDPPKPSPWEPPAPTKTSPYKYPAKGQSFPSCCPVCGNSGKFFRRRARKPPPPRGEQPRQTRPNRPGAARITRPAAASEPDVPAAPVAAHVPVRPRRTKPPACVHLKRGQSRRRTHPAPPAAPAPLPRAAAPKGRPAALPGRCAARSRGARTHPSGSAALPGSFSSRAIRPRYTPAGTQRRIRCHRSPVRPPTPHTTHHTPHAARLPPPARPPLPGPGCAAHAAGSPRLQVPVFPSLPPDCGKVCGKPVENAVENPTPPHSRARDGIADADAVGVVVVVGYHLHP
jgi:hypothetical protein